jgi:hypothetical protein
MATFGHVLRSNWFKRKPIDGRRKNQNRTASAITNAGMRSNLEVPRFSNTHISQAA